MSAVSDDAAATSRILSEVDFTLFRFSTDDQAMPSFGSVTGWATVSK